MFTKAKKAVLTEERSTCSPKQSDYWTDIPDYWEDKRRHSNEVDAEFAEAMMAKCNVLPRAVAKEAIVHYNEHNEFVNRVKLLREKLNDFEHIAMSKDDAMTTLWQIRDIFEQVIGDLDEQYIGKGEK
jgi:hypothetical protein